MNRLFLTLIALVVSTHAFVAPSEPPIGTKTALQAKPSLSRFFQTAVATATLASTVLFHPLPAQADTSRVVGQIAGSGIVFKDTLQVESFDDPKIKGVTLYISTFQRPINERLSSAKNFFTDPSNSAVACAKTGPVQIADNINTSPGGEEVFQESKSILFKSLRVQRIYDTSTNTVVYVSFNTRFDKNDDDNKSRFQNALCAVNLNELKTASTTTSSELKP